MVKLDDYLYSGDTVLKIIKNYSADLKQSARENKNSMDLLHCNFLLQVEALLEHNDFLTSQSQRIREFYKYMANRYPFLAFTFKGRIKSLIRLEGKFNGYIISFVQDYYQKYGRFPEAMEMKNRLSGFRDIIAYRIVISLPKCHLKEGQDRREEERNYLYEIANALPEYLEERGFNPEPADTALVSSGSELSETARLYFRDYVRHPKGEGYQSLHITFYDRIARCFIEVQLRTKEMDDSAEIGPVNHLLYEKSQEHERVRNEAIPKGECLYFDEACERVERLKRLDLSKLDVNMFYAVNNSLVNDGCGLYRGRQILPYEHLSRFQNDVID